MKNQVISGFVCFFVCLTSSMVVFGRALPNELEIINRDADLQHFSITDIDVLASLVQPVSENAVAKKPLSPKSNILWFEDCSTNVILQCCPGDDITMVEISGDCDDIDEIAGYIIDGFFAECTEDCGG